MESRSAVGNLKAGAPELSGQRSESRGRREAGGGARLRSVLLALVGLTMLSTLSFALGQVWESLDARSERQTRNLEQSVAWIRSALFQEKPELALLPSTVTPEVFRSLKTFELKALQNRAAGVRAGIVDQAGALVVHSIPQLGGTAFHDSPLQRDLLQPLFARKLDSFSRKTRGMDGLEVSAYVERLGNSPFALVVEIPSEGLTLSELQALGAAIGLWVMRCLLWVLGLAVFAQSVRVTRSFIFRMLAPESNPMAAVKEMPPRRTVVPPPPPPRTEMNRAPFSPDVGTDSLAGPVAWVLPERSGKVSALVEGAEALDQTDLLDHFEWEVAHLRDSSKVARRLVETASTLCQSPALFFRFDSNLQAAFLEADSGMEGWSEDERALSFPVDTKALGRILDASLQGSLESLSQFPPLSSLVLAHLGVSHFDAWAITGFSHLGRASRSPRLLGVLVILRAGVESHARRKSLGRMMRATGLVYENTILSQ